MLDLNDLFFPLTEAASRLGVSRATVWRWVQKGIFCHQQVGREILIPKVEVSYVIGLRIRLKERGDHQWDVGKPTIVTKELAGMIKEKHDLKEKRLLEVLRLIKTEQLNAKEISERVGINATNVKMYVKELRARGKEIIACCTEGRHYYELENTV